MKKYFKSCILFALMALTFAGCKTDDLKDDLDDLKDRVTLLEEQVKILNDNVEVFAYVLNPDNKTIYDVVEGNGSYTIILSNGEKLQLTLGSQGTVETPTIEVNDEGYWVINGVATTYKAKGEAGDNLIPEFRINPSSGKWEVRYGEDVTWTEVTGDYNVDAAGDKFFESAEIQGDTFVITGKNGDKYEMPIVWGLKCMIEGDDVIEFQPGTKQDFNVTIEGDGEPLAPIYPEGWRAELTPQTEVGKYTLTVYAPSSTTSTLSRATANNSEEVVVRANKGVFWAVDKINVRLPKEYTNNLEKFNDGILKINDISISKESLSITDDNQIKIISSNTDISESGVYFINGDDVTLTYNLGSSSLLDNVVIIPYVDDKRAKLSIAKQIYLNKNFVCQNVDIEYSATSSYVLRLQQPGVNIIMDNCTVKGMVSGSGFAMPQTAGVSSINKFIVRKSDFNIVDTKNTATNIINNMDCSTLEFVNNIVYRSADLTEGVNLNFKVLNANARTVESLIFNNNTIVGLESTTTAMVYAKEFRAIDINYNIFWNDNLHTNSMFIRYTTNISDESLASGDNNIGYNGKGSYNFRVVYTDTGAGITCPSSIRNQTTDFTKDDIFDTTDSSKFSMTNGTFIPNDTYESYGAQR